MFLFLLDEYSDMELLDNVVILFFNFLGTSVPFFIAAAPIYIPTNSTQGSLFLHIFISTCYFLSFLIVILTDDK